MTFVVRDRVKDRIFTVIGVLGGHLRLGGDGEQWGGPNLPQIALGGTDGLRFHHRPPWRGKHSSYGTWRGEGIGQCHRQFHFDSVVSVAI
jgi:hypothetical protein